MVTVPLRQVVKGRYIGGGACQGHESARMLQIKATVRRDSNGQRPRPLQQLQGQGFILCCKCNGSCSIITAARSWTQCPGCNEEEPHPFPSMQLNVRRLV
ncbi:hypothetical protein MLD38_019034 [Melastoma candidum]|uniref:Uncharacterized protein n=1 Tax=Melastoma candidum TaxID=119954 RepID=A0ACB9QZ66_9MYRT|nr:hypothetical protein MLD38_019034 [Melastoma candidum]